MDKLSLKIIFRQCSGLQATLIISSRTPGSRIWKTMTNLFVIINYDCQKDFTRQRFEVPGKLF